MKKLFKTKEDIRAGIITAIALLLFGSILVLVLAFLY
jgi:cellobiose-specific phosphotransferase system component IIC